MSDMALTSILLIAFGLVLLVGGFTGSITLGALAGIATLAIPFAYQRIKGKK